METPPMQTVIYLGISATFHKQDLALQRCGREDRKLEENIKGKMHSNNSGGS